MIRTNFIKSLVIATSLSVMGSNAYAADEKAGTADVDRVIAAVGVQTFKAPNGFTIKMDEQNHHLHKPVYVAEVSAEVSADPNAHAGHNPDRKSDKGKKSDSYTEAHSGHSPDRKSDKGKKSDPYADAHSGHNPDQ